MNGSRPLRSQATVPTEISFRIDGPVVQVAQLLCVHGAVQRRGRQSRL